MLRTVSAATSTLLWERQLSRERGESEPAGARPPGLLSYNGGIYAASAWDSWPRGALRSLPSIKHLPSSSPGPRIRVLVGSAFHSHTHRGCHNTLSSVELLPIWIKVAPGKSLQVQSCKSEWIPAKFGNWFANSVAKCHKRRKWF